MYIYICNGCFHEMLVPVSHPDKSPACQGFTTVDKKPVELRTFTVSFYDMDRRCEDSTMDR